MNAHQEGFEKAGLIEQVIKKMDVRLVTAAIELVRQNPIKYGSICGKLIAQFGVISLPDLGKALCIETNVDVQRSLLMAVGLIREAGAPLLPIVLALAEHAPDPRVRRASIWAVGKFGPITQPEAVETLQRILVTEKDNVVRLEVGEIVR